MASLISSLFRGKSEIIKFVDYINPDGTRGGRVATNAEIHPTVYVETFGKVLPGAKVGPNQRVKDGDFVTGNNKILRFD